MGGYYQSYVDQFINEFASSMPPYQREIMREILLSSMGHDIRTTPPEGAGPRIHSYVHEGIEYTVYDVQRKDKK